MIYRPQDTTDSSPQPVIAECRPSPAKDQLKRQGRSEKDEAKWRAVEPITPINRFNTLTAGYSLRHIHVHRSNSLSSIPSCNDSIVRKFVSHPVWASRRLGSCHVSDWHGIFWKKLPDDTSRKSFCMRSFILN